MASAFNKPTVFVSPTIYEFRDLRSALRYWLEEMGCEVRLSEFTDFDRRPEQDTFDSCFNAIADSNYYVLLVGGNKGSTYQGEVSVTQQEYRTAIAFAREGKIKPIIFVRDQVMTAIGERKRLQEEGLDPEALWAVESRVLRDPEFIEAFLDEISREQLAEAEEGHVAGTVWCYRFSTLRDIVDALKINLGLHASIRKQALLANLQLQLRRILISFSQKRQGVPYPLHELLSYMRDEVKIQSGDLTRNMCLTYQQAYWVSLFWLSLPNPQWIETSALTEAIASGEFLIHDHITGTYAASPVQDAILRLLSCLDSHKGTHQILQVEQKKDLLEMIGAVSERQDAVRIVGSYLMLMYAEQDRQIDILRLTTALMQYVRDPTVPFQMPDLLPPTPLEEHIADIEAERITDDDLDFMLNNAYMRDRLTQQQTSTQADYFEAMPKYPTLWAEYLLSDAYHTHNNPALRMQADDIVQALEASLPGVGKAWEDAKHRVANLSPTAADNHD